MAATTKEIGRATKKMETGNTSGLMGRFTRGSTKTTRRKATESSTCNFNSRPPLTTYKGGFLNGKLHGRGVLEMLG